MQSKIVGIILLMGMFIFPLACSDKQNTESPLYHVDEKQDAAKAEYRKEVKQTSKFLETKVHQAHYRISKEIFLTERDRENYIAIETQAMLAEIERKYRIDNIELLVPDLEVYLLSLAVVLGEPCDKAEHEYKAAWGYVVGKTAWVVATIYAPTYATFADIIGTGLGKSVGGLIYKEHCQG